ncbi:MAG: DUF2341 domain-containing protein [Dehalococcoidia bacterium]
MSWLSDWGKRVKLTTDHTDITLALSDFPILLHVSASCGRNNDDVSCVFDELQSDANRFKIAVTTSDGTTQCYVEIEKWDDANEQAWLWVKAPSLSSTVDDDFYLYYGSSHADNTTYVGDIGSTAAQTVWDSNFKLVNHMDYLNLTDMATNLPTYPASGVAGEVSLIMDGSQCDCWYNADAGYLNVYYAYATDSDLNSYSTSTLCLSNVMRIFVLKEGSTYYLFGHQGSSGYGDLYLYSSTNKTTWTIMNSGNPVLHAVSSGMYKYIWNIGVVVIGSTWHMFIECGSQSSQSDVGVAYSYSTLADLNWDTHRTATAIIPGASNCQPVYVPDRNAILLMTTYRALVTDYWDINAFHASVSDDLSLAASWTQCRNFSIKYPAIHSTDPHLVVAGDAFDYNIVISYLYNQGDGGNRQACIDLSLDDFYDAIQYGIDSTSGKYDGTKRGTFEPAQITGKIAGAQNFDGTNDYITIPDPFYVPGITIECWVNMDVVADYKYFANKDYVTTGNREYSLCLDTSNLIFFVWNTSNALGYRRGTTTFQAGTGYHCVATYDGTTIKLFLNGAEQSYAAYVSVSGNLQNTTQPLTLGYRASATPDGYLDGQEDEVRISNGARTVAWIKATYETERDDLLDWGSEEIFVVPFRNYYPHILAH